MSQQQRALETGTPRRDAYDADDEGLPPEGGSRHDFQHQTNKQGKWPRRRPFTGRALRPAPLSRSTAATGPLEDGVRANAPVSHRTGTARDAFRLSKEAPLDLEGLVETTNQPSDEGPPAPGGSRSHHPSHQRHDRVPAWSMADASESTSDELDRACRLPIGAERRHAFSLIREKIETRRRQRSSTTWNPFTLLSSARPPIPLDSYWAAPRRHPDAPRPVLLRETNSERRRRSTPEQGGGRWESTQCPYSP